MKNAKENCKHGKKYCLYCGKHINKLCNFDCTNFPTYTSTKSNTNYKINQIHTSKTSLVRNT